MVTLLLGTVVVSAYLLIICFVCAFLLKVNPYGEFDTRDGDFVWFVSALWPMSVPVLLTVALCDKVIFPLLGGVMSRITVLMSNGVDWAVKPREKKSELPKAQVRK